MARSSFQKLKILYVMQYLLRYSDEAHPVKLSELTAELERHGISAERKSIYDDIESLREFGLDINQSGSGRTSGYYIGSREFELPELKLLVDSVQSSKFITEKKTMSLISKIEQLTNVHDARELRRQVYVKNRIKSMNESIYYSVDDIHRGIVENKKIRFHYFDYNIRKERQLRYDGKWYIVSPYALCWDDENYYMIGHDAERNEVRHYRVDKMMNISLTEESRTVQEDYAALDLGEYARKTFGMFTGEQKSVHMRFENELVSPIMDRLGRDVMLIPDGENCFTVRTEVAVSPQFFSWIFGFGTKAKILGPADVVEGMRRYIEEVSALYNGTE